MNENLNLVEILKDCPKGTKFYSPVFGEVEFLRIEKFNEKSPIVIKWFTSDSGYIEYLRADGTFRGLGECIIFPSKDQRDWSKWQHQFVDGDIVTCVGDKEKQIFIIKNSISNNNAYCYVGCSTGNNKLFNEGFWLYNRLATEEEKTKLFQAIKDNGYKWNAETKTLEKLISNKFDPKILQPFDKVLVRDFSNQKWTACLFSHIDNDAYYQFKTSTALGWYHCIPFNEDTKHLVGKMDEAPEFYRYWDE